MTEASSADYDACCRPGAARDGRGQAVCETVKDRVVRV